MVRLLPEGKHTLQRHSEFAVILAKARSIGCAAHRTGSRRKMVVILNPASGGGSGPRIVKKYVLPVLQSARCDVEVMTTQYEGHGAEMVQQLDTSDVFGLLIAGGDGLVHELTTVILSNNIDISVSIIPVGTANALACNVYGADGTTDRKLLSARAALAAAQGQHKGVDVIKLSFDNEDHYALSLVAWGFAGAVVERAQRLRYLPWNRSYRYELAGALALGNGWPALGQGVIKFPSPSPSPASSLSSSSSSLCSTSDDQHQDCHHEQHWDERTVSLVNFMATNLPSLGEGRPVSSSLTTDDGQISVNMVHQGTSRLDAVRMLRGMKHGVALESNAKVESLKVTEFKISPVGHSAPFCIDGDPFESREVHVKVLNKALSVFSLSEASSVVMCSSV